MAFINRRRALWETSSKAFFKGPYPDTLVQRFKDSMPSFAVTQRASQKTSGKIPRASNKPSDVLPSSYAMLAPFSIREDQAPPPTTQVVMGKGVLCNRISEHLMLRLQNIGLPTHFMNRLNMHEQLVHQTEVVPLVFTLRNTAAGSLVRRFGLHDGDRLQRPIVEMRLDDAELGYPLVTEEHVAVFALANPWEIDEAVAMALRINDYLSGLFLGVGIQLVDIRLRFGRLYDGDEVRLVLVDEITPDTCRLWDIATGEKLDRDLLTLKTHDGSDSLSESASLSDSSQDIPAFSLEAAYQEVARRLGILSEADPLPPNCDKGNGKPATSSEKADVFRFRRPVMRRI